MTTRHSCGIGKWTTSHRTARPQDDATADAVFFALASTVPNRNGEGFADLIRHRLAEFRLAPGAAERAAEKVAADSHLTIVVDNGTVDIQ